MTKEIRIVFAYFIILAAVLFGATKLLADCTGCGKDGHEQCPIEGAEHSHDPEVVFAVCVFSDGTLIDHKGADNMSDCLKTKRDVEKAWRNRAEDTDSVEINGITYQIHIQQTLLLVCRVCVQHLLKDIVDVRHLHNQYNLL